MVTFRFINQSSWCIFHLSDVCYVPVQSTFNIKFN
jgi:hypothetical protein